MKAKGLVISPRGSTGFADLRSGDDIRRLVGGDFDWTSAGRVIFYCYEWANDQKPFNPVATALYRVTHPGAEARMEFPLCGTVVVVGPPVNSEETDVPTDIVVLVEDIKRRMGGDEIARRAVPLSETERQRIQQIQSDVQETIGRAIAAGLGIDIGGIVIAPLDGGDQ